MNLARIVLVVSTLMGSSLAFGSNENPENFNPNLLSLNTIKNDVCDIESCFVFLQNNMNPYWDYTEDDKENFRLHELFPVVGIALNWAYPPDSPFYTDYIDVIPNCIHAFLELRNLLLGESEEKELRELVGPKNPPSNQVLFFLCYEVMKDIFKRIELGFRNIPLNTQILEAYENFKLTLNSFAEKWPLETDLPQL